MAMFSYFWYASCICRNPGDVQAGSDAWVGGAGAQVLAGMRLVVQITHAHMLPPACS